MDDMQARIVEVLRYHELVPIANWETKLRCACGEFFECKLYHAQHVADLVMANG